MPTSTLPLDGRTLVDVLDEPVDRLLVRGDRSPPSALDALAPGGRLVIVAVERPARSRWLCRPTSWCVTSSTWSAPTATTPQDVVELFDLAAEGRLVLRTAVGPTVRVADLAAAEAALADDDAGLPMVLDPRPAPV